tara:strand:+ start:61 stop:1200 length:1140 start_codon:yes stop_codon:yes gene_type:complete
MAGKEENSFDYIIVGGGLAGLQLALAFIEDDFFKSKIIAIIEPSKKEVNDKTWCFWEEGKGKWEALIHKQWSEGKFVTNEINQSMEMGAYQYKMIRSIDFYRYALSKVEAAENVSWIEATVQSVEKNTCLTDNGKIEGKIIFDSRISQDFNKEKGNTILQHFKGIVIETKKPFFNDNSFTMMDFRLGYNDLCCFTYVLPFSATKALVEFTFFSPDLVENKVYDELIKQYIQEKLKLTEYEIYEEEKGVIPMSDYPFWKENKKTYLKIGTGGGWVKASSGYSFKNTERKVQQIIQNLKKSKSLDYQLFKKRFYFYDRIFLRILKEKNHLGNQLLQEMYLKNEAKAIFKFLDETSNPLEEFKIINSFKRKPFLWSLSKDII